MSNKTENSSITNRKRKSDFTEDFNQDSKLIKLSDNIIELSDDSDELKIVNEIKSNDKINEIAQKSKNVKTQISNQLNPMGLFLSKVLHGIDVKGNNEFTLTIKEILSKKFNESGIMKSSCQFSYLFDVDWLISQYDEAYQNLPLTIVAQHKQPTIDDMKLSCSKYSNIDLCFAKLQDQWGTHHTKMMLLEYDNGLRVIIHTSNLRENDWNQKTQGLWCSQLLPKLSSEDKFEDKSETKFQTDLIEYLEAYNCQSLKRWIALIKRHNFSSVKVFLIGSIPGRHKEHKLNKFGHMKLRQILKQYASSEIDKDWQILCQFSSIGTLGKSPDTWLNTEFLDSLKATKQMGLNSISTKPLIKIIFPTIENVRLSLEGYSAGASIPYQSHVAIKQMYLKNFMHQWKADINKRTKAQPHIKSYTRLSPNGDKISYFILTSKNLSKAAWGTLEKKSTQLNIRSYELGVLFLPEFHGKFKTFERSNDLCIKGDGITEPISMPLPFDWPLVPYKEEDNPWVVDQPYDKPDSHGMIWNP